MRIAIYHNVPSGGAKRAINEQVRRLSQRHQIDVFTLSSADHEYADIRPYVKKHQIFDFKSTPLFDSPFGRLNQLIRMYDLRRLHSLTPKIAEIIKRDGYDVLYAHPCQFENSPSILRYLDSIFKVFFCQEALRVAHEPIPQRPYDKPEAKRRQILNRLDPLPGMNQRASKQNDFINLHSADRVLVNSHFVQQMVKDIYQYEANVNYLGVDLDKFRPLQLEKQQMFFSVGSLTPLKAFDFLIDAISRIPEHQRYPLVIASNFYNPPEKDYLMGLALQKEVTLELRDNISDQQLVELYNQATVTVYAPIREPFGFVSIESMACGTPVVGVREGGLQETILHDKTGYLTEREPLEFAQAIRSLVQDPDRAHQFGQAGREHVLQNWNWERSVENLESLLSSFE